VAKVFVNPDTGRRKTYRGTAAFLGPQNAPDYFMVTYEDGDSETMTLDALRLHLSPRAASRRPSSSPVADAVLSFSEWDLSSPAGLGKALRELNLSGLADYHLGLLVAELSSPLPVPLDDAVAGAAVASLLESLALGSAAELIDPLPDAALGAALTAAGLPVRPLAAQQQGSNVRPQIFYELAAHAPVDVVVCRAGLAADILLPLLFPVVGQVCCLLCPLSYFTEAPPLRVKLLDRYRRCELLHVVPVPTPPGAAKLVWLVLFAGSAARTLLLRPHVELSPHHVMVPPV
jgi:hypothetical protein